MGCTLDDFVNSKIVESLTVGNYYERIAKEDDWTTIVDSNGSKDDFKSFGADSMDSAAAAKTTIAKVAAVANYDDVGKIMVAAAATESKGYSQTLEDYLSNRHRPDAHLALIFFLVLPRCRFLCGVPLR